MLRKTKIFLALILILYIVSCAWAEKKYEYKVVPLGSLTSLEKGKNTAKRTAEVENILNKYGSEGWEIDQIFAVRTMTDPNIFFVIMRRES